MDNSRNAELLEKHGELKRIIDDFDTTTIEKMNAEINDANGVIACLEAEKYKLSKDVSLNFSIISGKNSEIHMLNQSIKSFEIRIAILKSDLSKLKGKQIDDPTCVASISPRCEMKNS